MAKKKAAKETTSKSIIRDLVTKEWAKVKGQPRSKRGTKADVEARVIKRIAEKTGRNPKQIRDIEKGKRPGKNLFEPLKAIKRGRKVAAPPKEPKKITRRAKPKPPPQPPAAPPSMPNGLKVKIKGEIAPFKNDEYLRDRTVTTTLRGETLKDFMKLWTSGNEDKALRLALSNYFGGVPSEKQRKAGEVFNGYMPGDPEDYSFTDPITQEPIEL